MNTLTDSSFAFAQVPGIVFLVGGAAALFCGKSLSVAIDGIVASPALLWAWGFIDLLFGAAIIAFHGRSTATRRGTSAYGFWPCDPRFGPDQNRTFSSHR